MKTKFFLKKSHVSVIGFLILAYITLFVLGIFIAINRNELFVHVCTFLFVFFIVILLIVNYYKTVGLYIVEEKIYYKNFRKKHINPREIKGVIIIRSYSAGGKYRGFYPLKDNNGNSLYTAIFIRNITQDMLHFEKGDLWFIQNFKQYILTWIIYSEAAINHLKSLEPNIEIINIDDLS